jgi:N-acetylneuraminic acid mutarotase
MMGRYNGDRGLSYNEVYDPSTNVWTVLPSAPTGRSGAHAVVIGDKVFVFGNSHHTAYPTMMYMPVMIYG